MHLYQDIPYSLSGYDRVLVDEPPIVTESLAKYTVNEGSDTTSVQKGTTTYPFVELE